MSSTSLSSFCAAIAWKWWNVSLASRLTTISFATLVDQLADQGGGTAGEPKDHGSADQYGTAGSKRRHEFGV
jgi:hypothetical protein